VKGSAAPSGFGYGRLDDGDFDGSERIDVGAVEFGGLVGDLVVLAGSLAQLELWGPTVGALRSVPRGSRRAARSRARPESPSRVLAAPVLLASGMLPPSGTAVAWSPTAPAFAVGPMASFQILRIGLSGP
jgi:hypothetical protein